MGARFGYVPLSFEGPSQAGPPIAGLTGVGGWWDTSVTASLNLTGSTINSIADQSGAGNHLIGMAAKPTYNATGLNSRPAMMFTAASDAGLTRDPFPMGNGNTLTGWAVLIATSACDIAGRVMSYTAPGASHDYDNAGSFDVERKGGNTCLTVNRASVFLGFPPTDYVNGVPFRYIWTMSAAGLISGYFNNQVTTASGPGGQSWVTGGGLCVGRGKLDVLGFESAIAECGIATGYSDATAVGQLDAYLKTKWGL